MESDKRKGIELNVINASTDTLNSHSSDKQVESESSINSSTSSPSTVLHVSTNMYSMKSGPVDLSKSQSELSSQPKLKRYTVNDQNRTFQEVWFKDRSWLEYSIMNDSCYCFCCRRFSSNKLNVGDALMTTGFNHWKRSLESNGGLIKHASIANLTSLQPKTLIVSNSDKLIIQTLPIS